MEKPRNHVVLALLRRKGGSGAHIKSKKTQRQQNRQLLQKELKEVKKSMTSFLFTGLHNLKNFFLLKYRLCPSD